MRQLYASAQASQRREGERRLKENCVAPNARITTMDLVVQQPEIIDHQRSAMYIYVVLNPLHCTAKFGYTTVIMGRFCHFQSL